jgi:UDP-glucose 4-epimerase
VTPGAEFIQADLLDRDRLQTALRQRHVEAVIHMAAASLVGESMSRPAAYYENNVLAGLALLDAMREEKVTRLVFSSTAAVYGEPEKQPIEEHDPTYPTNPYGATKLAFEHALKWYSQAYDLTYTTLRYFNAAGATSRCGELHNPETHLIPIVLKVAAGLQPHLEVFGDDYPTKDGTCVRDYIHVVDLARAHILALQSNVNATYNLGCGAGYSVKEVIDCATKVTGRSIPVKFVKRRAGDPATLVASSDAIKRELKWNPRFQELELIIESAWAWIETHPSGYGQPL